MYKILIKHNTNSNKADTTIWRMHASITTSATTTYSEFKLPNMSCKMEHATLRSLIIALKELYNQIKESEEK